MKKASQWLDFANLLNGLKNGIDPSAPISVPMGPLSPINDLAGVLIQQYDSDLEEGMESVFQQELAEAKKNGLEEVRKFVDAWSHSNDYVYRLEVFSAETVNKLLQGKFKTFEELQDYDDANSSMSEHLEILYRKVNNKNRGDQICIIETIFINE